MNIQDEEIEEKLYKVRKDYTMRFFGFLTAHCYITTLISSRNLQYLLGETNPLNAFLNPGTYLIILLFVIWNNEMNTELNNILKSENIIS